MNGLAVLAWTLAVIAAVLTAAFIIAVRNGDDAMTLVAGLGLLLSGFGFGEALSIIKGFPGDRG